MPFHPPSSTEKLEEMLLEWISAEEGSRDMRMHSLMLSLISEISVAVSGRSETPQVPFYLLNVPVSVV